MSTSSSTSSSFPCPVTSSSTPATPGSGRAASTPAVVAGAPRGLPPLSGKEESQIRFLNSIVFEYLTVLELSYLAKMVQRCMNRTSFGTIARFPVVSRALDVLSVVDICELKSTPSSPAGYFLSRDSEKKIKSLNQFVFEYLNELQCPDMATQFKNSIRTRCFKELSCIPVVRRWVLTGITDGDDRELGLPTIVTRFAQVDFNAVERREMEAISMRIGQPVLSSPPSVPTALSSNQILHSTTPDFTLPLNLDLRFPSGSPHQTLPSSSATHETSMNHAITTSILSLDTAPHGSHDPYTSHDSTPDNSPLKFGSDWESDIPNSCLPQTFPYSSTTTNYSSMDHAYATSILSRNTAPLSSHEPFTSRDPTPADFPLTSGSDMEFDIPTSSPRQAFPPSSTNDSMLDHAIATSIHSLDTAPRSSRDALTSHDPTPADPTPADCLLSFGSQWDFDIPSSPNQMYPSSSALDTSDYTIDTPIFVLDTVPPSSHDHPPPILPPFMIKTTIARVLPSSFASNRNTSI